MPQSCRNPLRNRLQAAQKGFVLLTQGINLSIFLVAAFAQFSTSPLKLSELLFKVGDTVPVPLTKGTLSFTTHVTLMPDLLLGKTRHNPRSLSRGGRFSCDFGLYRALSSVTRTADKYAENKVILQRPYQQSLAGSRCDGKSRGY